jgi:transcriptional regulator with XRE-family HTH domain
MDKFTTSQAIGKRAETLRVSKGISRRDFALRVRIPLTSYRDRELGRLDFDLPQLRRMSPVLGASLTYLLTGHEAAALDEPAATESLAA